MKISILTENVAGKDFLAEHGVSYLIEIEGEKILFDTGHSDVFLRNATKLGINIQEEVKTVVLSHGHWDHGNGLAFLNKKTLITHPASFTLRFRQKNLSPVGLELSKPEIQQRFNLVEKSLPFKITKHLYFLGKIPRENNFEGQTTSFVDDCGNPDFVPDDSALAAIINNELVIITGCSHAGICNITKYAQKITGISKIRAIIGGFHLKEQNQQTLQTIDFFKQEKPTMLLPSHCTELPALALFYQSFPFQQLKTGTTLLFN